MPTYVRLVKVKDAKDMRDDPAWGPEQAAKVFEKHGGKVVQIWATLGPYDFVGVVEAPDDATMMAISAKVAALLHVDAVTMPAMAASDFGKAVRS